MVRILFRKNNSSELQFGLNANTGPGTGIYGTVSCKKGEVILNKCTKTIIRIIKRAKLLKLFINNTETNIPENNLQFTVKNKLFGFKKFDQNKAKKIFEFMVENEITSGCDFKNGTFIFGEPEKPEVVTKLQDFIRREFIGMKIENCLCTFLYSDYEMNIETSQLEEVLAINPIVDNGCKLFRIEVENKVQPMLMIGKKSKRHSA